MGISEVPSNPQLTLDRYHFLTCTIVSHVLFDSIFHIHNQFQIDFFLQNLQMLLIF